MDEDRQHRLFVAPVMLATWVLLVFLLGSGGRDVLHRMIASVAEAGWGGLIGVLASGAVLASLGYLVSIPAALHVEASLWKGKSAAELRQCIRDTLGARRPIPELDNPDDLCAVHNLLFHASASDGTKAFIRRRLTITYVALSSVWGSWLGVLLGALLYRSVVGCGDYRGLEMAGLCSLYGACVFLAWEHGELALRQAQRSAVHWYNIERSRLRECMRGRSRRR